MPTEAYALCPREHLMLLRKAISLEHFNNGNIYSNTVYLSRYSIFIITCNHNSTIWENSRMSQVLQEVLSANREYAANFDDKGNLPLPPGRRFAILTCMDARLDPAKYAGLTEGDAHVIRNAGGRASDDAIRSLVISYKLLGTGEWFVIHQKNGQSIAEG